MNYFFTKHTKAIVLLCCILIPALSQAQTVIDSYNNYLQSSKQVVLVTVPGSNATQGSMKLYTRKNNHQQWKLVNQFAVTLGNGGLGFDKNSKLPKPDAAVIKQEGDGKSPAGIFGLGPVFSSHPLKGLKMPFKQATGSDICVDDIHSAHYNTWVNTDTAAHKDWNSFEHMKSGDDSYEYGVWVKYNSDKIFSGNGSCIFLHVWGGSNSPTVGCTAMDKANIINLIHWLDEKKHPVLVQVVEVE